MKINWLHVVNSIGGVATVITGLNPAFFGPYAPQAAMVIGGVTVASNLVHAAIGAGGADTLPPPSASVKS